MRTIEREYPNPKDVHIEHMGILLDGDTYQFIRNNKPTSLTTEESSFIETYLTTRWDNLTEILVKDSTGRYMIVRTATPQNYRVGESAYTGQGGQIKLEIIQIGKLQRFL